MAAPLTIEQYAEFVAAAARLWDIVGDPRRLPDWTGAQRVTPAGSDVLPESWSEGVRIVVEERERLEWQVIGAGQRVVEASAETACGTLGIGLRVIQLRHDPEGAAAPAVEPAGVTGIESVVNRPPGARVVFVAQLQPSGSAVRARLWHLPALRRRFDRWATRLRDLTEG